MKIRDEQIVKKILLEINVIDDLVKDYTQELFINDEKTKEKNRRIITNFS
ncbi:MAG: hypothetical protein KGZ33_05470 [Alkaliphilus sp.]|nr:hypothetical protein [Alkaliphilus sp.]